MVLINGIKIPVVLLLPLILFLLTGCIFELPAPPRNAVVIVPTPIERSSIHIPVTVDLQAVRSLVEAELKSKPLLEGRTPELKASLLVNEKTIFQEPKQIVEVPYKAAACTIEKIPRQVVEHVKVGVKTWMCWLTPWRWGQCAEDVFDDITKTVFDDVTKCVPEQIAVVKTVLTPVVKLNEKLVQTSVWINYSAQLESLELSATGNTLTSHIKFNVPVSADVKAGILGADITAKGVLNCTSQLMAEVDAKVTLVENNGDLLANTEVSNFNLDLTKLCIPGAVELLDVLNKTNFEYAIASKLVETALNRKIQEAINKSLSHDQGGMQIGRQLSNIVTKLHGIYELGDQAWLTLEPRQAALSQLNGQGTTGDQTLNLTAGLVADVSVIYGKRPILENPVPVQVSIGVVDDQFKLAPRGVIQLKTMQELLLSEAKKFSDNKLQKAGFEINGVEIYQSDSLLVFAVNIKGTSWLRPSGIIYLSGKPVYDPVKRAISFEDFRFTAESRNWLLNNVAGVLESHVEDYLGQRMVFPIDDELNKLLSKLKTFEVNTQSGVLNGSIANAKLTSIWMSGDALNFNLVVEGKSQFTVKLN